MTLIYHVCNAEEWQAAQKIGHYGGSSQDVDDGFIHFSTAEQVVASTTKHRVGQDNLVLVVVDVAKLGSELKWESARNGLLFPHLYGSLSFDSVVTTYDLFLNDGGYHDFPPSF